MFQEDPLQTALWQQLTFEEAAWKWLETRKRNLSEKSIHEYTLNIHTLLKTFKPYKLTEISSESIQEYQKSREADGVGYSGINHETSVLQQVLKRARLWDEIAPDFHPIPTPRWQPGRTISEAEKDRLLRHAGSNPGWESSYLYAALSYNTSCGPSEIACLRLKDVELPQRQFHVFEGAKNAERVRPIPLDADEAYEAMKQALERAHRLGSCLPRHYLFPWRDKRTKLYDPTRHQTEFKWSWNRMCKAAGLEGLKPYDLRRTAITDWLNDPMIATETIIKLAGHVGKQMLKRYSYRRMDAMRKAVARRNKPKPRPKPKKLPHGVHYPMSVPAQELTPAMKEEFVKVFAKLIGA